MPDLGFWHTVRREIRRLGSRKSYLCGMVLVPVLLTLFFCGILSPGLPLKVPTAIVDLDHSPMSRSITRSLNATELVDLQVSCESYDEALTLVRSGRIFGFFVIPADFQSDVVAGRTPTLTYFNNLTYFVPGTLAYKGFKSVAVTTSAGAVVTKLAGTGAVTPEEAKELVVPVNIDQHAIGNPWTSYSIYLAPTFVFACLALMIYLMTAFAITMEIKRGTSVEWLAGARGRITVALAGKLLPHFVIWSVVGQFALSVMFCWNHYPCGNLLALCGAMELFVMAALAWAVFICCVVPNPRLAFSCCALLGILSFSFAGLSFPVTSMYGAIGIFSYLVPLRYMMLVYFTVGLDSFPLYYARMYFVALLIFPLVACTLLWRLKRACLTPVYVP